MEVEEWLNNNQFSIDIWRKKYQFNNETLDEWFDRVSGEDKDVRRLIVEKKFLFGGRVLSNRGTTSTRKVSLNNCYVLTPPEDNIESIYDTAKHMARTFSYSGGVGISLDKLAPKGAKVNNAASSSSGAVSFCGLYNTTGIIIGAEGRRSALMLSLSSEHPDIEDFINAKINTDELTKANMSVESSDEFMNAVDKDWPTHKLIFIRETGEIIRKIEDPKKLFNMIVKNNWMTGEPGLLYWDRIKNWSLLSDNPDFEFAGINPCQPLGEFIKTSDGFVKIENVTNSIYLNGSNYNSSSCIYTGEKEVFQVTLENGIEIKMTGNHKILTPYGDKELQTLSANDHVCMDYIPVYDTSIEDEDEYELGILSGWFVADGGFSSTSDETQHVIGFAVGKDEFEYKDELENLVKKHIDNNFKLIPHHQKPDTCFIGRLHSIDATNTMCNILQIDCSSRNKFEINLEHRSKEFKLGFLRSVFTCDGSTKSNSYAMVVSIEKEFIRTIQRLLIEFGVYGTLTLHNNPRSYIAKDGKKRNNKQAWKVDIYDRTFNNIGFLTKYKMNHMLNKDQKQPVRINTRKNKLRIRSIKSIGIMPVYDINVNNIHHYNSSGLIIHNCGEMPLPAYGACCLSSMNLIEYIKDNKFDFELFKQDIPIVVKAMNDVLDEGIPLHPLKEQQECVTKWRQIGIGCFSFASMLMKLGIKYGSDESLELSSKIAKIMLNESARASTMLAKEYGSYPAYNYEYLIKSKFYQENIDQDVKDLITLNGLRNSQLLSIAPTGSISSLFGVSGGIEPLFNISYERRTESLHNENISYKIYDKTVEEIMQILNITDEKNLPDSIICSQDIPYMNRIKMQAIWQQYIDASISSTVNLPKSATEDDIYNLYIEAWKAGLKGITVYRDGCTRQGILNTTSELKRGDWKPIAKDTIYDKIKLKTGCGKLMLFPGWSDSEQSFQEVWIKKIGTGGCERSIEAIAIECSAIFRLGGNLYNIEKSFEKLETCPSFKDARRNGKHLSKGNSCADCILKALQKYEADKKKSDDNIIKSDEQHIQKNICPECNTELIATGGCWSCQSCGYSRCG